MRGLLALADAIHLALDPAALEQRAQAILEAAEREAEMEERRKVEATEGERQPDETLAQSTVN